MIAALATTAPSLGNAEQRPQQQAAANQLQPPSNNEASQWPTFPLRVEPFYPGNNEDTANQDGDEGGASLKEVVDRIVAGATLLVLIIQTGVFGVQARRLRETIIAIKDVANNQSIDTREMVAANKLAAEAAMKSAKAAETALVGIDRPYIFLSKPVLFLFARERCRYPHAEYYIRNFGRTPAIITKRIYGLKFVENIPDIPPYEEAAQIDDFTAVEAGGEILGEAAQANRILDDSEIVLVRSNVLRSLLFGRIDYEDTFGNKYEMGFGYVRQPYDGRYASNEVLGACGGPTYNYHRKIKN